MWVPCGQRSLEDADPLDPVDAGDRVGGAQIAQLGDFPRVRVPEEAARREADAEHVVGAPVDEVEVEVVLQVGRVEHLVRHPADDAGLPARREQQLLRVEAHRAERVDLVGRQIVGAGAGAGAGA
ncbi:hypothetical protein NEOLI_004017, partial [Neolecta irregularis DAH-3]